MGAAGAQGPPVRNIHIQILPTDLQTFPYRISLEDLLDLFTVFSTFDIDKLGKIHQHHWKEHLKISKIAKFESDL